MSLRRVSSTLVIAAALVAANSGLSAQIFRRPQTPVSENHLRAHIEFLASDALQGRRSGTRDEWLAASYIAAAARQWGLEPAGDAGGFLQRVEIPRPAARGSAANPPAEAASGTTWNVVARLTGTHRSRASETILLSAHLDHVGVRGTDGDTIFNGADDDASGVAAVLELARVLSMGPRPDRTIVFAWFGSEETGGAGSRHFIEHPPVPLESIVANLQFEMVGRPDPAVPVGSLWLTGFERSNLGAELARRGARLVADPHPAERFFFRSDNVRFAYRGIVAHTVSSYGLHREYHTARDELSTIDFAHITTAVRSLVAPVRSLANSSFVPGWTPTGRPQPPGQRPGA